MNEKKVMDMLRNKKVGDIRSVYGQNMQKVGEGIEKLATEITNGLPYGRGLKDITEVHVNQHHLSHLDFIKEQQRIQKVHELRIAGEEVPADLAEPIVGEANPVYLFQQKAIEYFGKAKYKTSKAELESNKSKFEDLQAKIDARIEALKVEQADLQAQLQRYGQIMNYTERGNTQAKIAELDRYIAGVEVDPKLAELQQKQVEHMEKYTLARAYVEKFEFDNKDLIAEVERERLKAEIK